MPSRSVPYVINSEGWQKALRYRYASAPHWDNRMVRTIDWKKVFISHAESAEDAEVDSHKEHKGDF